MIGCWLGGANKKKTVPLLERCKQQAWDETLCKTNRCHLLEGDRKGGATVGAVGAAAPTGVRQWGQTMFLPPLTFVNYEYVFWRFCSKAETISGEKPIPMS